MKFSKFIQSKDEIVRLALTDRSYRRVNPRIVYDNRDLAALGGSVLDLAVTEILYDEDEKKISEARKKYVSDRNLVECIAKEYFILPLINYDDRDPDRWNGYRWSTLDDPEKTQMYIPTAVKALLGAYYIRNDRDMGRIIRLVDEWMDIIDRSAPRR